MLNFIKNKSDCVGCTACYSVCPTHCISMEPDEEGFLYPVASDACIHCGKCQRVCPIQNLPLVEMNDKQYAYAALSKDEAVWRRSASGGAFSEICRAWDDGKNVLFVGAAWNGLDVHHIGVVGFDSIEPLCKSKYVASNARGMFPEIKNYLNEGKRALFCGTPCQVAGLKNYLGRDYDNLFLIDLVCHGVGSPKVFKTCIEYMGKQLGYHITGYEFRVKRYSCNTDHLQKMQMDNQKYIYVQDDPYIQLFLSQLCLRPSCGKNCIFRSEIRQGDITIADFKGLIKVFPELLGSRKNYSTIVANTKKGYELIRKVNQKMIMKQCPLEAIKEHNPLFYRQTWFADNRDKFMEDFISNPEQAIADNTKLFIVNKRGIKRIVWSMLPQTIRKNVLKFLKRGGLEPDFSSCKESLLIIDEE